MEEEEESRGGIQKTKEREAERKPGSRISLQSAACPSAPTPTAIGIHCGQAAVRVCAASLRNIKN